MRLRVEKPIVQAFAVVAACAALVGAMQLHLWQARAYSVPATPAIGMSTLINEINSNGHSAPLPIQVVGDPI
jgi:hypothetical protein